jgi:hypothetical protein
MPTDGRARGGWYRFRHGCGRLPRVLSAANSAGWRECLGFPPGLVFRGARNQRILPNLPPGRPAGSGQRASGAVVTRVAAGLSHACHATHPTTRPSFPTPATSLLAMAFRTRAVAVESRWTDRRTRPAKGRFRLGRAEDRGARLPSRTDGEVGDAGRIYGRHRGRGRS